MKVYGEDFRETRSIAEDVLNTLQKVPGAVDLAIDQEPPLPQLQVRADCEAMARYGVNVADLSELIEVAIGGKAISQVFSGNKVYDVICRYSEESRNSPEKIANLMLTSQTGAKIPLSQVTTVKTGSGEIIITREMNKRHLTVRLNLRGTDLGSFLDVARASKKRCGTISKRFPSNGVGSSRIRTGPTLGCRSYGIVHALYYKIAILLTPHFFDFMELSG